MIIIFILNNKQILWYYDNNNIENKCIHLFIQSNYVASDIIIIHMYMVTLQLCIYYCIY